MRRDGDTAVFALAQSKKPKAQSVLATRDFSREKIREKREKKR